MTFHFLGAFPSVVCYKNVDLNLLLFDVLVEKPLVEIATNGVVDKPLTHDGFVARLVSENDVVVPSAFRFEVAGAARSQV